MTKLKSAEESYSDLTPTTTTIPTDGSQLSELEFENIGSSDERNIESAP